MVRLFRRRGGASIRFVIVHLDEDLLSVLCCPNCRGGVVLLENGIVCRGCRLVYPIRDGIPVMLVEEAKKLEEKDSIPSD